MNIFPFQNKNTLRFIALVCFYTLIQLKAIFLYLKVFPSNQMVYLIIIKIWFTALSGTGECLHRPDCVGLRSSIPASMCTLASEPSAEPIETDDLWLVVNELVRFEGR